MPPRKEQPPPGPPYSKDERVLCFHMDMLYEAKVLDVRSREDGNGWQYKIHYKGWKSSWDDWVPQDRIRKFTDENKELASQLLNQYKTLMSGRTIKHPKKSIGGRGANGSDLSSARGSEERNAGTTTSSGRGPRRIREFELENEEHFQNRPCVKLPIADHLKAMLVDDWENITKHQQLVPLPHPNPVNKIFADYLKFERMNRQSGSASIDVLEETIAGLKEYFDKSLGRILLYRFERPQYHEMYEQWTNGMDDKHKGPCDTYGAEHLCRLLVSLPELIAQTNMDQQSVNRLRQELMTFSAWFSKHVTRYFVSEYEKPSTEYIDKARSV
ncbi:chromatin modification-related protein eaf3 [Diplogelasinospora grovesii]|uniref:Chromatin modification-related protein EAF3 n=1 Tax=Diplogelasinospora grovesii TaxID=303347 RepID=A0AAN6NKC6_9PEZI|nr:chromatin modification-related protein eaf3 [Diplogelasinospora grovesii]